MKIKFNKQQMAIILAAINLAEDAIGGLDPEYMERRHLQLDVLKKCLIDKIPLGEWEEIQTLMEEF